MSAESHATSDQQDSADLAQYGYKQELKRSLGLGSSFAVAFSYISPSTGIFTLFALGLTTLGGVFIWTWPVVALGQFIIALNFAEVSSHYPVAGSVFQWTKYLANRSYSWFTGWIYLFAGHHHRHRGGGDAAAGADPRAERPGLAQPRRGRLQHLLHTQLVVALITLVVITVLNIYGVRLVAIINNTGVVFEILGMFVFALVLLAFHNHQGLHVVTNSGGIHVGANTFLAAMFMSLFVIYGFDTASTLAEETRDPRRAAPKAVLYAVIGAFIIGGVFLLGVLVAIPAHLGVKGAMAANGGLGLGPAQIIDANFSLRLRHHLPAGGLRRDLRLLPVDHGSDDPAVLRDVPRQHAPVLQAAGEGVAPPAHAGVDLHRDRRAIGRALPQVRRGADHRHRGHRHDLPELLPRQHRDLAGPRPRLAEDQRAVPAGALGHARQHSRPHVRRGDADQHRLAAGREQPRARSRPAAC